MATDLEKAAIAALIISLMLLLKKKTKEKTLDMGQALVNKMGNWQRKTNNPSNKPDTTTLQTSSSDKVFITWFKKKNHPETIETLSYDLQNKRNISISKEKSEIKNWKSWAHPTF